MSIAESTPLLLFALVPFSWLLVFLALSYVAGGIEGHESRRARIKGVIRNLVTIFFLTAPLLVSLIIILWVVSLS